jgi:hypothetical protein
MQALDHEPTTANVVGAFDTQDEADEALLELRLAGYRDEQIGYYSRTPRGETTDLLERNFWIAGSTVGAIVGAVLGFALARILPSFESSYARHIDSFGLAVTCATFGALFISCVGGMIGAGMHRRCLSVPHLRPTDYPFVMGVDAGTATEPAVEALARRGGHDIRLEMA